MKFGIISAPKIVFYSFKHLHSVTIFPPYTENSIIFTGKLQAVELISQNWFCFRKQRYFLSLLIVLSYLTFQYSC